MSDAPQNSEAAKANAVTMLERLRPLQEAKGFYFNPDQAMALDIMEQLLALKERYGYMCCPCRLSTGEREKDKDISCPCQYRDADVQEHGSCYCGLYVDADIAAGRKERHAIPERRPIGKILA